MKSLCVIPTYRCNIKCDYCYNDTHDNLAPEAVGCDDRFASAELLNEICSALAEHGVTTITISGGEPLISKLTPRWLDAALGAHMGVHLITNLTVLPPYLEEFLESHENLRLTVSIGGINAASHNYFRDRFSSTFAHVEKLKRVGARLTISLVLDRFNACQLKEISDYCVRNGFGLTLSPLSTVGATDFVKDGCLSKMSSDEWHAFSDLAASPSVRSSVIAIRAYHEGNFKVATCAMRNAVMVLNPDGGLYGCFFRKDIYHGNLFKEVARDVLKKLPDNERKPADCFTQQCLPILVNN